VRKEWRFLFRYRGKKKVPWFCLITNKKRIILMPFVTFDREKGVQVMSKMPVYREAS